MREKKIKHLLEVITSVDYLRFDSSGIPFRVENITFHDVLTGEDDNELIYIGWHDDAGEQYYLKFTERSLADASVYNSCITLEDHEGMKFDMYLYTLSPYKIPV